MRRREMAGCGHPLPFAAAAGLALGLALFAHQLLLTLAAVVIGQAVLGRRAGDRVQVDMGGGRSYWITIRSIEKGTDDGSIPIGSF